MSANEYYSLVTQGLSTRTKKNLCTVCRVPIAIKFLSAVCSHSDLNKYTKMLSEITITP